MDKDMMMRRLMANVEKRGSVRTDMSPCWKWMGSYSSNGYGQLYIGKHYNTHRLSYYLHNNCEDIPDKKYICHKCDNKECCNPSHLYCGTPTENIKDTFDRGIRKPKKEKAEQPTQLQGKGKNFTSEQTKGENNIKAILNWEKVREIRNIYNNATSKYGVVKKLSEDYGVAKITITKILANKLWIDSNQ